MAKRISIPTASAFLHACAKGSSHAYNQCKRLLCLLECHDTRPEARRLVSQLYAACEAAGDASVFEATYHFSLRSLVLDSSDKAERLLLLQLPSTFTPEAWSFTFYEGLTRYPVEAFAGKQVCELGCGNGWVSLALGRKASPQLVTGIDINPKAVLTSRINLYVNSLDDQGQPVVDADGRCLLEKVRFETSDLLSYFAHTGQRLDMIVGCIPQVLSPDPEMPFDQITDQTSDAVLYALSNYAPSLGYIEDQFGLGLIAKALEQAIEILQPGGKVILNLGGRPGRRVLEHLFTRRGYQCRRIWQTKVWQAEDTDITPLVDIEKRSAHRFEFYVSLTSDQPINATTAQAFVRCGGQVAHALCVYEAELRNAADIRTIFATLGRAAFQRVRDVLDLAFPSASMADEKTHFLADLCTSMQSQAPLGYDDIRGNGKLRRSIAHFLRSYHRISWHPDHLLILPNRDELIQAVFSTYVPQRVLVSADFTHMVERHTPHHLLRHLDDTMEVLETPNQVDATCRLVETLSPAMVITQLNAYENRSIEAVMRLIQTCGAKGARLFLDISPYLDLSSEPAFNGVLAFLSDHVLPPHAAVFAGLVKNQVYANLQVCLLLSENQTLLTHLLGAVALGYSRTPALAQHYYASLFDELLSFQMDGAQAQLPPRPGQSQEPDVLVHITPTAAASFAHPSVRTEHLPMQRDAIRWDYGENELPAPEALHVAVLTAFAKRELLASECDPREAIAALLAKRYGLDSRNSTGNIITGLGVAPIFAAFVAQCKQQGKTLLMPRGTYGQFVATSMYHGCPVQVIETAAREDFKLTPTALHRALEAHPQGWVYCCYPVVNPTGAVYSAAELSDLLSVCKAHRAVVLLDTLFHGLEYHTGHVPFHLGAATTSSQLPGMVLLGGVSKEFAAGGLRFGYAWSNETLLASHIAAVLSEPHETTQLTVRYLLEKQVADDPQLLVDQAEQRRVLRDRAARLATVLAQAGWKPLPSHGGLFMVATPAGLYGRSCTYDWGGQPKTVLLNATNIAEALFASQGLLINNDVWTGIPGFCRFVLSVTDEAFARGIAALEAFYGAVAG
jgi:methionine S-methyltransferase